MATRTLAVLALLAPLTLAQRTITDAEVLQVHRSALLIDTHNDVPLRIVRGGWDFGVRSPDGHTDLPRLKAGGVGATFFAAYVAPAYADKGQAAHRALAMIDAIRTDIIARYPHDVVLATTADQIVAAHKQGKFAALIGVEGGHAIEDDVRVLRTFYDLGVRYMTLTHTNTNNWADSSGDIDKPGVQRHDGLTGLGREIIAEMNRLGMMIDLAHVSDKTFWDVLEVSRAPVFSSHSSCRALTNVRRNLTDDMIKALAKKGGLIDINFACEFLAPSPGVRPTIDDVVRHIQHVKQLVGVDHIGIGSDFDGITCAPVDLDSVDKYPNLTRKLLAAGFTTPEVRKIYGGNFLRFMRAVAPARP